MQNFGAFAAVHIIFNGIKLKKCMNTIKYNTDMLH